MMRFVVLIILLLSTSVKAAWSPMVHHASVGIYIAQSNAAPLRLAGSVTQIAETTRLKMLAAIARGDIQSAIVLWQVHFEGFRVLGKQPAYLKLTTEGAHRGANLLAFEVRAGDPRSTVQISENFVHYAVQVEARIYDAFTGPRGLIVSEYMKRLVSLGNVTTETVSALP